MITFEYIDSSETYDSDLLFDYCLIEPLIKHTSFKIIFILFRNVNTRYFKLSSINFNILINKMTSGSFSQSLLKVSFFQISLIIAQFSSIHLPTSLLQNLIISLSISIRITTSYRNFIPLVTKSSLQPALVNNVKFSSIKVSRNSSVNLAKLTSSKQTGLNQ